MVQRVIAQHVELAASLWTLREMAVVSHHYALPDLVDLEDRVEAHLEGIQIAGEPALEMAASALGSREPGAFFTAAAAAIEARDHRGFGAVLDATEEDPGALSGVAGALAWATRAEALAMVGPLLSGEYPMALFTLAIAACAAHGHDPGDLLGEAMFARDADLRTAAFRATGQLGRMDIAGDLQEGFEAEHPPERYQSAWAGALLGVKGAVDVLWAIAGEGGPFDEAAAEHAARVSAPVAAREEIELLAARPGRERVALVGAGALGDPALLGWVVRSMDVPSLARLAGESLSRVTGSEIEGVLRGSPPPGEEIVTGSMQGADPAMPPDAQLPWPSAAACQALCAARRFPPGARLLLGQPVEDAGLQRALREGTQRRRAGAAFELAARAPGRPLFNVTARAARQVAALRALP